MSLEQSEDSLELRKITWSSLSQSKSKPIETISNQGSESKNGQVSAQGQRIDREDEEEKISSNDYKVRENEETMRGFEEKMSKLPWCTKFIEESSEISFQDSLDEVNIKYHLFCFLFLSSPNIHIFASCILLVYFCKNMRKYAKICINM